MLDMSGQQLLLSEGYDSDFLKGIMLGKGRKSDSPTPPSKQIRQKRWSEVKWSGFHLWSLETPT